jgi:hypothetical protein
MKHLKRYRGILFIVLALVVAALTIGGCGGGESTPASSPPKLQKAVHAPSKAEDVQPNDSVVQCQISLFLEWSGANPSKMRVYVRESTDVAGMTNYTKDQVSKDIDVIIDEDLDWLMLGQQLNCNIKLEATPEGGTAFHIYNITH